jgi:hypothetical protein
MFKCIFERYEGMFIKIYEYTFSEIGVYIFRNMKIHFQKWPYAFSEIADIYIFKIYILFSEI